MPFSNIPRTMFMILVASSACVISVQVQNIREENYPLAFSRRVGENEIVDPNIPHGDAIPWDEFRRRNRYNANSPVIVQQYRDPNQLPSGPPARDPPARDPPGRDGNLSNDRATFRQNEVANPAPGNSQTNNLSNNDASTSEQQSSEDSFDYSSSSSSSEEGSSTAAISAPVVPLNPHVENEDLRRNRAWTRVRSVSHSSNIRRQAQALGQAEPRLNSNRISRYFSHGRFNRNTRATHGSETTQNSVATQPTTTAISRP